MAMALCKLEWTETALRRPRQLRLEDLTGAQLHGRRRRLARDFSERSAQAELGVWLHARAWTTAERPSVLFDLATARLIDAKVLLPGASVLARLIAAARDQATERLYATLSGALTPRPAQAPQGIAGRRLGANCCLSLSGCAPGHAS